MIHMQRIVVAREIREVYDIRFRDRATTTPPAIPDLQFFKCEWLSHSEPTPINREDLVATRRNAPHSRTIASFGNTENLETAANCKRGEWEEFGWRETA
jgi:hypothetical protein